MWVKVLEILLLVGVCTAVLVVAGVFVLRLMLRRFFRQLGKDAKGVADSIGYMARMGRPAGKDSDETDDVEDEA
jgi:hypothetical protein